MKKSLLAILITTVFLVGAYYMGNYMLYNPEKTIQDQIVATFFGVLCWIVLGGIVLLVVGIYQIVCSIWDK